MNITLQGAQIRFLDIPTHHIDNNNSKRIVYKGEEKEKNNVSQTQKIIRKDKVQKK